LLFHCFITIWLSFDVYALQNYNFFRIIKQNNMKISYPVKPFDSFGVKRKEIIKPKQLYNC